MLPRFSALPQGIKRLPFGEVLPRRASLLNIDTVQQVLVNNQYEPTTYSRYVVPTDRRDVSMERAP
jgi:hypothetical protein